MPQKSGFFDTTEADPREYPAREFAEYFSRFIGNGIFGGGTNLQVSASGTNHKVSIAPGYAWINGYIYNVYDESLVLDIEPAIVNDRIDRIVLRLNISSPARSITALVIKGTEAASPAVPDIVRSGDLYDISLAQVRVTGGGLVIQSNKVTDERLNNAVCGIVTGVVEQADTTDIFNQFQAWYNTKTPEFEQDFADWLAMATAEYDGDWLEWFNATKTQWQTWFDSVSQDAPVVSVNGKAGVVVLSAGDVGAETPTGAQAKVDAHEANKANPHEVTATQVGLGNVQNYGIASQAEAEAGASGAKYMTPQRTKQYVDTRLENGLEFRMNTGVLEYNDGSGWKAVGANQVLVASNTLQVDKPTEYVLAAGEYNHSVLVHKFIPKGLGEIIVSADVKNGNNTSAWGNSILFAYSTEYRASNGGRMLIDGSADYQITGITRPPIADWRTPEGSRILTSATYDLSTTGIATKGDPNNNYSTITGLLKIHNLEPIYFLFRCPIGSNFATDKLPGIKNFKIFYDAMVG